MAVSALTELGIIGDFALTLEGIVRQQNLDEMKRRNALRYGRIWRLRAAAEAEAKRHIRPAPTITSAPEPEPPAPQEDNPPMSRLTDKLKRVADRTREVATKIEAEADALLDRGSEVEGRIEPAFAGHKAILSEAARGLDDVEGALALLSNDPLGNSGG